MNYDFHHQLTEGEQGERFLDAFFRARGHTVSAVSREEQRQGIDRLIETPAGVMRVEYKTDYLAARTGNAFIETISVDSAGQHGKMGWALTTACDYLIYYLPETSIYVLPVYALRWALPGWMRTYPAKQAANHGYQTHGILVPLPEVAAYAVQTFTLG